MAAELTPEQIKTIRKSYGLSQKSFARILGIGDASIVRYENGQKPTRAIANLILAARNKQFMLDCIDRAAKELGEKQAEHARQVIYAEVDFDERGNIMGMNEIYEVTLSMEVLNEQAAEILGDLFRMQTKAEEDGDTVKAMIYDDIAKQIALEKFNILNGKTLTDVAVSRAKILALRDFAFKQGIKAA